MEICERIVSDAAQEYLIDSNEALEFKLVRCVADIESDEHFKPEMSHQVYGESEQIFGYRDLKIQLFCTAGRLNMYCNVTHTGKMDSSELGEIKPDELVPPLVGLLPANTLIDNLDTFVAMTRKEATFKPFGNQIHSFNTPAGGKQKSRSFGVYQCDASVKGFLPYFKRLQMFTMFYIDAASYIDTDDPKWTYFIVFEKYQTAEGTSQYAFVGYTTTYEFYGYPEHIRPRISQMLVLPPFQRMGVGSAMLETIYKRYVDDPKVLSITVEDPSPVFSNMRLIADCRNCLQLPAFSRASLGRGLTEEHYTEGRTKLKLTKESVRAVYNVLRLRATNTSDAAEMRTFRLHIKNQLYAQFRRQDKEVRKLERCKVPWEEIEASVSIVPYEKRKDIIHQEYLDMEAKLRHFVDRLPSIDFTKEPKL